MKLPNDKETEQWFIDNIGINNDCSASSAIYKFRLWLNDLQAPEPHTPQSVEQDELEKIVCAAIWYKEQPTAKILPKNISAGIVVGGLRHGYCISTFVALTGKRSVLPECGEYVQGFITSKDRFLDRREAMKLAKETGQVTSKQSFEELYSEDLY